VTEQEEQEEFAAEEETAVDSLEEPPLGGQNEVEETEETAVDIDQGLDTEVEQFENEEDVAVEDYEG
jgi:hypothetical protein